MQLHFFAEVKKMVHATRRIWIAVFLFVLIACPMAPAMAGPGMVRGHITYVWTSPSGNALRIGLDQAIPFPGNCDMSDFLWIVLPNGVEGSRFVAAVMTAYSTKSVVNFWVSTCSTDKPWGGTHPVPDDIYVGGGF